MKIKAGLTLLLLVLIVYASNKSDESIKWTVRRIDFSGNEEFSQKQLSGLIELKPKWPFYNKEFSLSKLHSDLRSIEKYYRSQGYFFVKASVANINRDSVNNRVFIQVDINEGNQFKISSVQVESSRGISDSSILKNPGTRPGKPFNARKLQSDEELIISNLNKKGYLKSKVRTDIVIDSVLNQVSVSFNVNEGPLVSVGKIQLEGVKKLKPKVVLRELTFDTGDTLGISEIKKTQRLLYRTDLFSIVRITPLFGDSTNFVSVYDLPDSSYPILITIDEADFFRLSAGLGYGTSQGVRSSLRASYCNLFRLGHKISFKGSLSQKLLDSELLYSTPWLFGIPVQLNSSLYYKNENDPDENYEGTFRGVHFSAGQKTGFDLAYELWVNYEDVKLVKARNDSSKNDNIQSIGISLTYDTRDEIIDPHKGFFNLFETSFAGIIGNRQNRFVKIENDLRLHWSLGNIRFGSGLKLGWVCPYGSEAVPVQERFYGGGARSVRGFKEKHLREDISGNSERGNLLATANLLECRIPLFWWFQGAAFMDCGYIWDQSDNKNISSVFNDLRWSAGFGIRLNTPIAVLRFDTGFKLDRKPDESPLQIHFDIGQPF